jgi:hypothetical protein
VPKPENLVAVPHCNYIKDNGIRCGSPALRDKKLCYFHERRRKDFPYRRPYRTAQFCRRADFFNVKTAEDVMRSLNQVMNAVLIGQLSPREAGAIIFALQTATLFTPCTTPVGIPHPAPLFNHPITRPPDHPTSPRRTVDEIFEMFPGLDDLKAMLTPEDIASIEGR